MKNKISLLILFTIVVYFSGCKKYDEGPAFTLRTVKSRLTNGDWILDRLTVNGVDSTAAYREIEFSYRIYRQESNNLNVNGKEYRFDQVYTHEGQLVEIIGGYIYFEEKGDVIIFDSYSPYSSSSYPSPIFGNSSYTSEYLKWDIKKLTNEEFWLETRVNTMRVSMKLKKD